MGLGLLQLQGCASHLSWGHSYETVPFLSSLFKGDSLLTVLLVKGEVLEPQFVNYDTGMHPWAENTEQCRVIIFASKLKIRNLRNIRSHVSQNVKCCHPAFV